MLYKCVEGIKTTDINKYVIPSQSSLRGHSKKLYSMIMSPLSLLFVKVERAATSLRDLIYEERLNKLQLPTLTKRRERGDMIMLYKCVEGIEKIDINE